MSWRNQFVWIAALVAPLICAASAPATTILSVDVQAGGATAQGNTSPLESGFSAYDSSQTSQTYTVSGVLSGSVVALATFNAARDRGTGLANGGTQSTTNLMAGAFSNLYEDFGRNNNGWTLTLTGLNPSTNYVFSFQAFDADWNAFTNITATETATDTTTGGATNGTIVTDTFTTNVDPSGSISPGSAGTGSGTFTSNSSGTLSFAFAGNNAGTANTAILNGFEISTTTAPEPASLGIMAVGAVCLIIRRRNRHG